MVNLTRRFKLEYEDAVDGTTIMAETGQDTGAPKIDRHVHIRRKNDADILKLWIEEPDFGNTVPTDKSDFGTAQNNTDEPEILYKQYDQETDSFKTKGRFYAKNAGSINSDGELAVKLYSFLRFTAKDEANVSNTTDIEDALNQALPSGYIADVPSAVTPPTTDYSANARKQKVYQELTRNYGYAFTFTGNLDANNNYKVKFEPVGQGGTVDTLVDKSQTGRFPVIDVDTTNNVFVISGDETNDLVVDQAIEVVGSTGNDGTYTISSLNYDSSNNETDISVNENVSNSTANGSILPGGNTIFESWEKDKTDSVINKVKVEGTDSSGTKITATAENTSTQSKVGVKKKPTVKVGYIENATEALEIAQSYLIPGKDDNGNDISELPESGRVKTAVYSDNVVNDSFQVVSNRLNIDDTYTVVQQRNFWPEGTSKLEFEFEQEGLEEQARDKENLRDERSRLFPTTQTDVGNQSLTTGDALSNTSKTGGVGDTNDRNDDLSNVAKQGGVGDSNDRTDDLSNVAKAGGVQGVTTGDLQDVVNNGNQNGNSLLVNSSGWTAVNDVSASDDDAIKHLVVVSIENDSGANDVRIVVEKDGGVSYHVDYDDLGGLSRGTTDFEVRFPVWLGGQTGSSEYKLYMATKGSGSPNVTTFLDVLELNHIHPDNITADNNSMGLTDDIDTDNQAMGLTDDIDTDDDLHGGGTGDDQHGGSTEDNVNVTTATEDKTDR